MAEDVPPERPSTTVARNNRQSRIGAARGVAKLLRVASDQLGAAEPLIVHSGPRVEALKGLAEELADSDTSDDECVQRLRAAASQHRKPLQRASALIRLTGFAKEYRIAERAGRLLDSAASGEPVRPLSAQLDHWFSEMEELESLPIDLSYERLRELQPELGELELRLARSSNHNGNADELWDELLTKLDRLLGPGAANADPLLRSGLAHNIARLYLAEKIGLITEIESD